MNFIGPISCQTGGNVTGGGRHETLETGRWFRCVTLWASDTVSLANIFHFVFSSHPPPPGGTDWTGITSPAPEGWTPASQRGGRFLNCFKILGAQRLFLSRPKYFIERWRWWDEGWSVRRRMFLRPGIIYEDETAGTGHWLMSCSGPGPGQEHSHNFQNRERNINCEGCQHYAQSHPRMAACLLFVTHIVKLILCYFCPENHQDWSVCVRDDDVSRLVVVITPGHCTWWAPQIVRV